MTDINEVHKIYEETLHIEDTHLIDISLGTYKAKDIATDPVWLMPSAPSSFGKTTMLQPYIDLSYDWNNPTKVGNAANKKYNIFYISQITAATFASGSAGKKDATDLGHWLKDNKSLIIISDLASIATMDAENVSKLMGMFRTLFDGSIKVDVGTTNKFYDNIKCNMLAFATPEVKQTLDIYSLLGTREISYSLPEIKDKVKAMKVVDTDENKKRRSKVVKDFIDTIREQPIPEIDASLEPIINQMAFLGCKWRTAAISSPEGYLLRHISEEYPMRLKNQLVALARGLLSLGLTQVRVTQILLQVVNKSGNQLRREIMSKLFNFDNIALKLNPTARTCEEVANMINIAPLEIQKEMFVLKDMGLVSPRLKSTESMFRYNVSWYPTVGQGGF